MTPILSHPIRFADLPQRKPTRFSLVPDAEALAALADRLGVDALRKLRFEGQMRPGAGADWVLEATLGVTIDQPCRVTTDKVTTRIDDAVTRLYAAEYTDPSGAEVEMPEDAAEPLPESLDLGDVLEEELALVVPEFPRSPEAEGIDLTAGPPGTTPLTEERARPFAGLADLKKRMDGEG